MKNESDRSPFDFAVVFRKPHDQDEKWSIKDMSTGLYFVLYDLNLRIVKGRQIRGNLGQLGDRVCYHFFRVLMEIRCPKKSFALGHVAGHALGHDTHEVLTPQRANRYFFS